jgi:hypothetical protein
MADEYEVKARIELDATRGKQGVLEVAEQLRHLHSGLGDFKTAATAAFSGARPAAMQFAKGMQGAAASMNKLEHASKAAGSATRRTAMIGRDAAGSLSAALRSALAFAGAYIGVRALTSAMSNLVTSSFKYGESMEKNTIALASVLAMQDSFAKRANPMGDAMQTASGIAQQLQKDALKSVGTTEDLFKIYSQITGPLYSAGASLAKIRTLTNDTVSAAASLGVDFGQAARDVNLMATGVAGQDTMLFRMLRATGAIKQNTEDWNKMMQQTPEKGVKLLGEALAKFRGSADVYAKSLPGLMSSFSDFIQRFRAAFMSGPLGAFKNMLGRMVTIFDQYEQTISGVLAALGNKLAGVLTPAMAALERFTVYLITHWDDIAARIESASLRAAQFAQKVGNTAQTYAPTLKVAGAAMVASRVAPGAASAVAAPVASAVGGAATSVAGVFQWITAIAGLGAALAVAAVVIAVVVAIVGLMVDAWSSLVPVFGVVWSFLQQLLGSIWGVLAAAFSVVFPLIKILAAIAGILGFVVGIILFAMVRMVAEVVMFALKGWQLIFEYLGQGVQWIYEQFLSLFKGLAELFGSINADLLPKKTEQGKGWLGGFMDEVYGSMAMFEAKQQQDDGMFSAAEKGAPGARKTTINDFRGSKIEVKQDFRQADPDRVWLQMVEAVHGAAERRVSSALVPDFTG